MKSKKLFSRTKLFIYKQFDMENKILKLLNKVIKEDEDTFIDITNMDDDSSAKKIMDKKDIFKKLRDKMTDKDRTSGEMGEELHGGQSKIDVASPKGKITAADFKKLRDSKKSNKDESEDSEMKEGNAFSGALAKAKEEGKSSFEVDGKKYPVRESKNKGKSKLVFTESELINFIERLVEAEKVVDKGFTTAMNSTKKENTDAMKQVASKMKDYMKNMGTEYNENPKSFPKGNKIMSREDYGKEVSDDKKNAYDASEAVDEYIDAFAYPGQTNLVFDEIKPDDTKIEKYLKGHSTTGNAQVDEEGNPLGNVVPSEVGEKFYKNYKENLYGAEQMNASYKRQPAPVDVAGSEKSNGNLKSLKASQQIFNKLGESVTDKKVITDLEKMKKLIGYNSKTQ